MATRGTAWDAGATSIAAQRGIGPSTAVRRGAVGSPTGPTTTTTTTEKKVEEPAPADDSIHDYPGQPSGNQQQQQNNQNNGTPQDQWNQSWMRTGGINPSQNWMDQNRQTGQQTSANPNYFSSQPGQNDIQNYYNSRGIAPQGNSVQYWASKYPELVARGRQLNPNSDGTWYFNKFLSNAEEFTGGPQQTAYNMWGISGDPHPGGQYNGTGQTGEGTPLPNAGVGPSQDILDYLARNGQQANTPIYNRRNPNIPQSQTQIRQGM